MKQSIEIQDDITTIRRMMERSVKFISLSGLSGILSGVYALAGYTYAYLIVTYPRPFWEFRPESIPNYAILFRLAYIAGFILIASLITGVILSNRKAKKANITIWNTASRRMLINLAIPLLTGGILILIFLAHGYYEFVAPGCLIFYGLALINASPNLYEEIRYLGYCEIILGLLAATFPFFGLLFWAIGFGVLHILYGAVMYHKYER